MYTPLTLPIMPDTATGADLQFLKELRGRLSDPPPPPTLPGRVASWSRPPEPTLIDVLIDGLTRNTCLLVYTGMQREGYKGRPLTPRQKAVAQEMWAAQLKSKVAETETKERNRVVVDREFEDYE